MPVPPSTPSHSSSHTSHRWPSSLVCAVTHPEKLSPQFEVSNISTLDFSLIRWRWNENADWQKRPVFVFRSQHWSLTCYTACLLHGCFNVLLLKSYWNCANNNAVPPVTSLHWTRPLIPRGKSKHTTPANRSAPETFNTPQMFEYKQCAICLRVGLLFKSVASKLNQSPFRFPEGRRSADSWRTHLNTF